MTLPVFDSGEQEMDRLLYHGTKVANRLLQLATMPRLL